MELKILKPRQALNKAFLKVKPNRIEIDRLYKSTDQMLRMQLELHQALAALNR